MMGATKTERRNLFVEGVTDTILRCIRAAGYVVIAGQLKDQVIFPWEHAIYFEGYVAGTFLVVFGLALVSLIKGGKSFVAVLLGVMIGQWVSNEITYRSRGAEFYNGELRIQAIERPPIVISR